MKITIKANDPAEIEADVLIFFSYESDFGKILFLNKTVNDLIKKAAAREDFEGKEKQYLILSADGNLASHKILVSGLGEKETFDLYKIRKSIAEAFRKARSFRPEKVALVLDDYWFVKFKTEEVLQAATEAVKLSSYSFIKYKSQEEKAKIKAVIEVYFCLHAGKISSAEEGIKRGLFYSEATCFARDLINEPADVTTPSYLAKIAQEISKESKGKVKLHILEKEEIEKLSMNAYLAVAKGSNEEPKFIRLDYRPVKSKKHIVIVGKGITFDTGGLSLKSSEHMEKMKSDMAGAAAVLSIFKVLPYLKLDIRLTGLIPACENMPGGGALKPGDILISANGKSIEVLNTDAEGRLTLADAFSYAVSYLKPDYLIDLATLTGACMVALGENIAGLWSNDEELAQRLLKSSFQTGEKIWRMPLFDEYKPLIKSDIADFKNIQTGKYGGAITAALFLAEFTNDLPWAHLDIAGPAFVEKDESLAPKGGAGFGVRLLLDFLEKI